ncbi:MAG TPA: GTP-binding protein [Pirellulaceae bacterium]|nr:GTP-binding protein [Pirellulaceae bacterium]
MTLPEDPTIESTRRLAHDDHYRRAQAAVGQTLAKLHSCSADERKRLQQDFLDLTLMSEKLENGRVDIVVFGEISTGKSALINALIGREVAAVDVRGGWTKEVWQVAWDGCGYVLPGLANSQVVLVDTPGLNEVGGAARGDMAREAAAQAELILFVTDSDLNETEYSALQAIAEMNKPIILVLNKVDIYSPDQRQRLLSVLRGERVSHLLPADQVVTTSADPREVEYVIESANGQVRNEWRKPQPNVTDLKARILEVLDREGLALIALNAAMYASDKSDRIASLRIQLRDRKATQTIAGFAVLKSLAVALNPLPVVDVFGGSAIDISMVLTLSRIYGLEMSWMHARKLVNSILHAAGWVLAGELATSAIASLMKGFTVGLSTAVSAIPQGSAAGFGSYIVGQAAKYYLEHGSSWGGEAPKSVVSRILEQTDKQSVLEHLREEIKRKLSTNPHAR